MKKSRLLIIVLLIITIIMLIVSYLYKNDDTETKKIDYTTNIKFTDDNQLLAVAYLNSIEDIKSKYINNLENIKVYQTNGESSYLIIPRHDNIKINIYDAVLEEDTLVKREIINTTNLPFVITCDNSNIILEINFDDKVIEYTPSLSLEDNKIKMNEYILDITK